MMIRLLVIGLVAFALSALLTAAARPLARRFDVVARPRGDRWNRKTIPLLGGVAVGITVLVVMPGVVPLSGPIVILLAASAFALGLGLLDDVRPLPPYTKLIAQIVLAATMVAAGLRLELSPYALANVALTILWIVGIANAFNLLDNMDGLAAGIAVITVGFRLAFFLLDGDAQGAAAAAVLLGAVAGFLVFNFPPASIFMGDAGSLFIGVLIAGLSLGAEFPYSRNVASVLLVPVLILLVPIFDTSFVAINRTLAGRPVSQGGRDHLSHRLVALGLSERAALGVLSLVAACSGAVAYLSSRLGLSYGVVLIAFLLIATAVFAVYLSQVPVYSHSQAPATVWRKLREVAWRNARAQQLATVTLDAILIGLAYHTAYLLRYEDALFEHEAQIVASLPLVLACQLAAFAFVRVHQVTWRYAGVDDMLRVGKAASAGLILTALALSATHGLVGYSPSVFVLDWLLLIAFVGASRGFFRLLVSRLRPNHGELQPVLIYGAGDGGVLVLRELLNNLALNRLPVGFVDDDPGKQHLKVQGLPVLGSVDQLPELLSSTDATEVLIATGAIPPPRMAAISKICAAHGVPVVRAAFSLTP
jgi:UDP-GlcNAc:undecaprenyl-phosphate GlcNAc-1-phosphate transferase